ncbi:5-formyltetrahydrofolate cyclo-ligase, mitochondrial isoform X2 [Quercus suber]|uniref:5-formyltetrahydrofolate cyclo-ligase, mitochondrial isoform X2 n=1 Tax=Quercus suber TaxID=58331 RepID=UPI0032DFEF89
MRPTGLSRKLKQLVVSMTQPCNFVTTTTNPLLLSRLTSYPPRYSHSLNFTTMMTNNNNEEQDHLNALFKQKQLLRSRVRKELKNMDPTLRSQEDDHTKMGKTLYVPRVEDKNSQMRMLNISSIDDLIANSMNILEPASVDGDGNERKNVMQANEPVDLFLLPGLAFDRSGRRLGRGGGYYDTFLKNYQELVKVRDWKQPLLVALSYSLQILDEGVIPVTANDVPVDALVSPAGVIPISPDALDRMKI